MTISKALLGAAVALVIAIPATAQAQCNYRMNSGTATRWRFTIKAAASRVMGRGAAMS
jgi:biopolymer transport protein ExbB/TolQ